MRVLIALLLLGIVLLQYRLWVGEGSLAELRSLQAEIDTQRAELVGLRARNEALQAEVSDLKRGLEAIEERARNELGMTKSGEVFYQIVDSPREPTE